MTTQVATLKGTFFSAFSFASPGLRRQSDDIQGIVHATSGATITISPKPNTDTAGNLLTETRDIHPFSSMFGVLSGHSLHDEFLEILGVGQENQ